MSCRYGSASRGGDEDQGTDKAASEGNGISDSRRKKQQADGKYSNPLQDTQWAGFHAEAVLEIQGRYNQAGTEQKTGEIQGASGW